MVELPTLANHILALHFTQKKKIFISNERLTLDVDHRFILLPYYFLSCYPPRFFFVINVHFALSFISV